MWIGKEQHTHACVRIHTHTHTHTHTTLRVSHQAPGPRSCLKLVDSEAPAHWVQWDWICPGYNLHPPVKTWSQKETHSRILSFDLGRLLKLVPYLQLCFVPFVPHFQLSRSTSISLPSSCILPTQKRSGFSLLNISNPVLTESVLSKSLSCS